MHCDFFTSWHFGHTYAHNLKTTGLIWICYILNNCSTIGDLFSMLELDVRYDWWVTAPNTHHSLFPLSHLCMLTHIHVTSKLQVIYRWSAYWRLLYYWRHSLCCLQMHERSDWRATAPDMHQLFSDKTMCMYMCQPSSQAWKGAGGKRAWFQPFAHALNFGGLPLLSLITDTHPTTRDITT